MSKVQRAVPQGASGSPPPTQHVKSLQRSQGSWTVARTIPDLSLCHSHSCLLDFTPP